MVQENPTFPSGDDSTDGQDEVARLDDRTRSVTFACPCCGYWTLAERGGFDICKVCYWEDDGQDDHDADTVRGGPNGSLSLTQARFNFKEFGACERRFADKVRPPLPGEIPES